MTDHKEPMNANGYNEGIQTQPEEDVFNGGLENDKPSLGEALSYKQEEVHNAEPVMAEAAIVLPYAGFWLRFWAYLIDLLIIGSLDRLIVKPLIQLSGGSVYNERFFSPMTIATTCVFFLYFLLMTRFFQQTLGKMVFGLKVVSLKGEKLTWISLFFREIIGRYICKKILILYLLVGILPKKQGLHDIFADTCVILDRNR
ncbi:RDD family protein [Bacillus sp. 1P06AnD]|uniref:RDD family protein n=1 Tax=Bacillus sp. 1P06AnD TaxID=3132208 RepID=UPI0039A3C617